MGSRLEVDVGVIGAGPGGYHAAIRAAQLGSSVALIEENEVGGVCLNRGCIPTKIWLNNTNLLRTMRRSEGLGLPISETSVNLAKIKTGTNAAVRKLVAGLRYLISSYGIRLVKGTGILLSPREIKVSKKGDVERVKCKHMVIATGSKAVRVAAGEMVCVINAEDVFTLEEAPQSIIILGGDTIGTEFAYVFSELGVDVTIVERASHILPSEDPEVALRLQRSLTKGGARTITSAGAVKVNKGNGGLASVFIEGLGKRIEAEKILTIERKPNIQKLGLASLGVKVNDGKIYVNDRMETSVKGIYAVGDVVGGKFAHVAFEEGIVAAENIAQKEASMDYRVIPRCVFTVPEVASVGLTEEQAIRQGYETKVGKFPFTASGRAITLKENTGFVKIIADLDYGEILGVHIIGPRATDLIGEAALAMKLEATVDDLADTIHAHPTISEALREAALAVRGRSIHLPRT